MKTTPEDVLEDWFGSGNDSPEQAGARRRGWFAPDAARDQEIRERFGAALAAAGRGELDAWAETARGRLALIVLLDQFPRNLHRGSADALACDTRAVALCTEGLERAHDRELAALERSFFYMPLMHAEDLAHQEVCVARLEALCSECSESERKDASESLRFAREHREVIARFGRFPHRNLCLGRTSSDEERRYLEQGGESWGQ